MDRWRDVRRTLSASGMMVAALALAACGSSGSNGYGSSGSGSASASSAASSSGGALTITTASGPVGTYLTDGSGRALYLWVADTGSTSTCAGACASAWPPLVSTGTPQVSGSAMAGDLGTTKRSDGGMQVTYKGHPLYYFIKDTGPNQTLGQGSNGFGAKWWLVDPSGKAITAGSSASGAMSSSSSSSSSSGYGNG